MFELPKLLKKSKDKFDFFYRYKLRSSGYFKCDESIILSLKNRHKGDKCFIVGTGPSIRKTNLSLLKNQIVFGVNTLYRAMEEYDFDCLYYAVSDGKVWDKHHKKIRELDTKLFLSSDVARQVIKQKSIPSNSILLRTKGYMSVTNEFSSDPTKYVIGGHTVIIDICLQLAFYMGFKEVYLIGTDYSNLGTRWDGLKTENTKKSMGLYDSSRVIKNFNTCRDFYEKHGRKIYNATKGGALEVFKRVDLEKVI